MNSHLHAHVDRPLHRDSQVSPLQPQGLGREVLLLRGLCHRQPWPDVHGDVQQEGLIQG